MDGKFIRPKDIAIGGLYEYDYLPDPENREPVYDPHPLMLCLRRDGKYAGGINFHYLRKSVRKQVMEAIQSKMDGANDVRVKVPAEVIAAAYHLYKMENFRSPALLVEPKSYRKKLDETPKMEGRSARQEYNISDKKMTSRNSIWVKKVDGERNTYEIVRMFGISNKKAQRILDNNPKLTGDRLKRLRTMYGIKIHRKLPHGIMAF